MNVKTTDYDVSLADNKEYVVVRTFVPISLELRRVYLQAMVTLANKHKLNCFLIDISKAPSTSSILDDYQSVYEIARQVGLKTGARIAALVAPTDSSRQFVETAANNAGYLVKLFTDESVATDWLCAPST
jgi:hypothetical protein